MTTLQQLYDWANAQARGVTAAEAALALNDTEVAIQQLLTENSQPNGGVFDYDPTANTYAAAPDYVPAAPVDPNAAADATALASLEAAICTPTTCANDVDTVLATTGVDAATWARGNNNIDAVLNLLRCANLRTKLQSAGLNLASLDGMLDSCDAASLVNTAMITHYGQAGV